VFLKFIIAIPNSLMIHRFCLGILSANPRPKKERRYAAALYSIPSGHEDRIEENKSVNDIRRRAAMRCKAGYLGCASDAFAGS